MTHETEGSMPQQPLGERSERQSRAGRVSFLDQALWKQLRDTGAPEVFLQIGRAHV